MLIQRYTRRASLYRFALGLSTFLYLTLWLCVLVLAQWLFVLALAYRVLVLGRRDSWSSTTTPCTLGLSQVLITAGGTAPLARQEGCRVPEGLVRSPGRR